MTNEKMLLVGLVIIFVLGVVGLLGITYRWLMSPPKPRNNRYLGREFINHED